MSEGTKRPRALIAMSGGVDSSAAALLMMERGYDCIGVTMKLFDNEDAGVSRARTCCSLEDVEDARGVCYALGIRHYVCNFSREFKARVIDHFVAEYARGATPNPCIDCNRCMKFDLLERRAAELDCDCVATGHYARIERDAASGRYLLRKARDTSKDQSYVLYALTQAQLARAAFPLGELTKAEVRKIAEFHGFRNARKRDSQDICFVPEGNYADFIERWAERNGRDKAIVAILGAGFSESRARRTVCGAAIDAVPGADFIECQAAHNGRGAASDTIPSVGFIECQAGRTVCGAANGAVPSASFIECQAAQSGHGAASSAAPGVDLIERQAGRSESGATNGAVPGAGFVKCQATQSGHGAATGTAPDADAIEHQAAQSGHGADSDTISSAGFVKCQATQSGHGATSGAAPDADAIEHQAAQSERGTDSSAIASAGFIKCQAAQSKHGAATGTAPDADAIVHQAAQSGHGADSSAIASAGFIKCQAAQSGHGATSSAIASAGFIECQATQSGHGKASGAAPGADAIKRPAGHPFPPGNFVDRQGRVLGRHEGIIRYTVGQRKGLGLALGRPMYVTRIDPVRNEVVLGEDAELYSRKLTARDINLIAVPRLDRPLRVRAKIRYRQPEQWATAVQTGEDELEITFDDPQRAITPGQAVVLYDGDLVIGGGTIRREFPP